MVRIRLYFEVSQDETLNKKFGSSCEIIRLRAGARFKLENGNWSDAYNSIIDTGAYVSLIPKSIWQEALHEKISEHKIKGIQKSEECTIPVIVGKVICVLADRYGNVSEEMKIHAFLAKTDSVPLILGFKDLLSKFEINFNYKDRTATAESLDNI